MWSWTGHICRYQSTISGKICHGCHEKISEVVQYFWMLLRKLCFSVSIEDFSSFLYWKKAILSTTHLEVELNYIQLVKTSASDKEFFNLSIKVVAVEKLIWQLFEVWFIYILTVCSLNHSKLTCIILVNSFCKISEFLMNFFIYPLSKISINFLW